MMKNTTLILFVFVLGCMIQQNTVVSFIPSTNQSPYQTIVIVNNGSGRKDVTLFSSSSSSSLSNTATLISDREEVDDESDDDLLLVEKQKLLGLLRARPYIDPVLADPTTKGDIVITTTGSILGGNGQANVVYEVQSMTNKYEGSSNSYINLLEPVSSSVPTTLESDNGDTSAAALRTVANAIVKQIIPLIPSPLRSVLSSAGSALGMDNDNTFSEYIPMRDLFTSPAVSYAYERGWRQNFERAGFPGPDKEAVMAMEYFEPCMVRYNTTRVLVDMSCATGIFTRRFVTANKYKRVLGCDYSASMLQQARQFINDERTVQKDNIQTQLDLIRLDVGQIPMKDMSVDSLHAGAAMHCWPQLQLAISEIYRVLKPGGRYFATTFLSSYFSFLRNSDGPMADASQPSRQSFQYFASTDDLKKLLISGGFEEEKISIEVLGNACVVIRCEK